jgi:hypothetical protein
MAIPAQSKLIRDLAAERDIDPERRREILERLDEGRVAPSLASAWIERLLTKPVLGAAIPAGRYAIVTPDELGQVDEIRFYEVDRPERGKWAGAVFVSQHSGPDSWPVRGSAKASVLQSISLDPAGACALYGREIGSCGVCGLRLTNEESRRLGIGPVCREKRGW